jgi:hypothetical protein
VEAHRVVRRRGSHILSRRCAHKWRWGCQPCAPAALHPAGRFLVLISLKGLSQPQGHSVAGWIRSIEKSSDLNGNRTRDLLACSIVPIATCTKWRVETMRQLFPVVKWLWLHHKYYMNYFIRNVNKHGHYVSLTELEDIRHSTNCNAQHHTTNLAKYWAWTTPFNRSVGHLYQPTKFFLLLGAELSLVSKAACCACVVPNRGGYL